MKNLRMIMSMVLCMNMTACLSSGGSTAASSAPSGGGNGGGPVTTPEVSAIDRNVVSTWGGDTVTLTLINEVNAISTVTLGGTNMSFTQTGSTVVVPVPAQSAATLDLVVTDNQSNVIPFDTSISGSVVVQAGFQVAVTASSQTGNNYSVVSVSLQKMLNYTGSGFSWEAQDGTQTALVLAGFDFANFQNIGLSAAGDLVYGTSCTGNVTNGTATCLTNRYLTTGAPDSAFSTVTFSNVFGIPQIIGEDATYIYFNQTGLIASGSSLNVSRYVKTSGALDTAFGTAGIATVQDTYESSNSPVTNTPLHLDSPRMTIANGNLYFQAISEWGRYLFILSQTDGSRITTPAYFGGYEAWQILGNNAAGNFRNSLKDQQNANGYFSSYGNNSGNLLVNSDGTLLSLEGPLVVAANADYSLNAPVLLAGLPLFSGLAPRAIDMFQLPSGHYLLVYGISQTGTTSQQICGVVVDSTVTPLTEMNATPSCQAAQWGVDGATLIPGFTLIPNSDGTTHITNGNQYTYLLNGSTLQSVQFTIVE